MLNAPVKVSKPISDVSMTAIPALTLSHQITQHRFKKLDIVAEGTGVDHGRAIVLITGLTKSGNAHQCSRPDGSIPVHQTCTSIRRCWWHSSWRAKVLQVTPIRPTMP